MNRNLIGTILRPLLGIASLAATQASSAAAFQILEQSPAHLGHAFAGTASNVRDASTVFFNPAGMTQLPQQQVTLGGNVILVESEFNDRGSNTGGAAGETNEPGFVPNLYYVQPLNADWSFGVGLNAPFGLTSDYDQDWTGRYLATESELEVISLSGALAYQISSQVSVAFGLSYQEADVTLRSQIDSTLGVSPNPATDSSAVIKGDDNALAADLSVFMQPFEGTRLGLVWHQGASFSLEGNAAFIRNDLCQLGAGFPTGSPPLPTTGTLCSAPLDAREGEVEADVDLPHTLTLSGSQQIDRRWSMHADISRTEWSRIDSINIVTTQDNTPVDRLELEYDNTLRYALGASYNNGGVWTWRAGVAFDEAPQTDPELVTPRIPDEDRTWISLGLNWELPNHLSIDIGYAHLFVEDTEIADIDSQTGNTLVGNFDSRVDIFGIQANWRL